MSLSQTTLNDLLEMPIRYNQRLLIELMVYETSEEFTKVVNKAVDDILERMARNPQLRQDREENEITIEIVDQLNSMGFDASFDQSTGGHCDITVDGHQSHRWLGEAKKDKSSPQWIWEGFLQLDTRYLAATSKCRTGGILVYSYRPNISDVMSDWKARLQKERQGIKIENCTEVANTFYSTHDHEKTKVEINIRHFPLCLFFDPKK